MSDVAGSDTESTFSYDGEYDPDAFSRKDLVDELTARLGGVQLRLEKLAEGGYHKIYKVYEGDSEDAKILRVAAPAFPRDKLASEVATMRYITRNTNVPLPELYIWNYDSTIEYILMSQVPGVPASQCWDDIPLDIKRKVVSQIASYIKQLYSLKFDLGGSLIMGAETAEPTVGPIISSRYYRALDGDVRLKSVSFDDVRQALLRFRGPFNSVSAYLKSSLEAELFITETYRDDVLQQLEELFPDDYLKRLDDGQQVIRDAIRLCELYPGDHAVLGTSAETQRFSIKLDDFRLSNIMIDEASGDVKGLIDFEGATIAPLWECATIPRWLQPREDPEGCYEGGEDDDRAVLRRHFLDAMDDDWKDAYKNGRPFRLLSNRLHFEVGVWASLGDWVKERLGWADAHPGSGYPDDKELPAEQ